MKSLKTILAVIGGSLLALLSVLLERKSSQLQKARVELLNQKGKEENDRSESEIASMEAKVESDDKIRLEKERVLSDDLSSDDDSGT